MNDIFGLLNYHKEGRRTTAIGRPPLGDGEKWHGSEEIMKIAKKYGKVKKLKMDEENTPNNGQIFYIKYEQREKMNKAQIELIEEEIIAEVTAIEEQRVNMTKTTDE